MTYLKLIRWPNLLIIALVQILIRLAIVEPLGVDYILNYWYYALGVISTLAIAAGGYIVNDIFDQEVDQLNKPSRQIVGVKIRESTAWQAFLIVNFIAVVGVYFLSRKAGYDQLWYIPILAGILLYFYSADLKKRPLIGNILVSFMTALPIFLVPIFDVLPTANEANAALVRPVMYVIFAYSAYAFWINWIREIAKDAEDHDGDKKRGYKTLAILLGLSGIRWVLLFMLLVLAAFAGYIDMALVEAKDWIGAGYILVFIILPVLYLGYKVISARETRDFGKISTGLKWVMLTGILSMLVFTLSMQMQMA